jgi:hypothetical protein
MRVELHRGFGVLTVLLITAPTATNADPPAKLRTDEPAAAFADPKTTYRTYIEAVRRSNVQAAKQSWMIDDDNRSGALDTLVGMWVSTRRLNHVAEKKFGAEGRDAILKGWRREDVTDRALDLTERRLDDAEVKNTGDTAELKIKWKDKDGYPNAAFQFGEGPVWFRKVGGNWKFDANRMPGLKHGADFFEKGTWGPMFRDQVLIMNEAIDGMERGKLKTAKQLGVFIENKVTAMKKKYEQERK